LTNDAAQPPIDAAQPPMAAQLVYWHKGEKLEKSVTRIGAATNDQ